MSDIGNTIIRYSAATIYARKIDVGSKLVNIWDIHRARMAKLDTGYFVLDKSWTAKKNT